MRTNSYLASLFLLEIIQFFSLIFFKLIFVRGFVCLCPGEGSGSFFSKDSVPWRRPDEFNTYRLGVAEKVHRTQGTMNKHQPQDPPGGSETPGLGEDR